LAVRSRSRARGGRSSPGRSASRTRASPRRPTGAEERDSLAALATTTDKTAYWQSDTKTFTGANGRGADMETTGLAAYGLVNLLVDLSYTFLDPRIRY